ncbi:MAG: SDR family NAD(P)-dependent oxidoreductase [Spirochaetales bacterium]|uniref:SDR family NAD(P)-dependent oxidoreductase n=1 Tax=Candidatus Thalassospirochaeta sargassi TaxID=3119039 RepID=A0AAJ1IDI7_9SPIO|nr:SDR family NAD(P)-dependent oxidoreductase [Spirochaetales bacterium]
MAIENALGSGLGLLNKKAVITGGAVNIGAAISRRLAELGVVTAIVYNYSSSAADKLVAEIEEVGGTAAAFQADVADAVSMAELFAGIEEDPRFGRVDIMVNNSGIFSMSEQTDLSAEEWQRLFNINTMGVFLGAREAAKLMKSQPALDGEASRGVIINMASINALHPGFGQTVHYDATKGAVHAFTRSFAAELGPHSVRVNAVAPGLVDSEGLRDTAGPLAEMVEGRNPLSLVDGSSPLVKASDVANAVVFLSSSLAAAVTGETLVVDRGYLLT